MYKVFLRKFAENHHEPVCKRDRATKCFCSSSESGRDWNRVRSSARSSHHHLLRLQALHLQEAKEEGWQEGRQRNGGHEDSPTSWQCVQREGERSSFRLLWTGAPALSVQDLCSFFSTASRLLRKFFHKNESALFSKGQCIRLSFFPNLLPSSPYRTG